MLYLTLLLAASAVLSHASVLLSTRDMMCRDPEALPLQPCVECTPCPIPENDLYALEQNKTQGKTTTLTSSYAANLRIVSLTPNVDPKKTDVILEVSKDAPDGWRVFGLEAIWGGNRQTTGSYINWYWLVKDFHAKRSRCAATFDFPIDMFTRATVREWGTLSQQCDRKNNVTVPS